MNAPEAMGKANPMYPGNTIVVLGTKHSSSETAFYIGEPPWPRWSTEDHEYNFIVGCNISFDLLYLYKQGNHIKDWLQKQRIWDIQLVEYLLSAQQNKWPSLDEMSKKYGLPVKDDAVTKYFNAGRGADAVPRELLDSYLKQDLLNTEAIALKQMVEVTKNNMMDLVISQNEALHCMTEMMFNGLCVDAAYFVKYAAEVATNYADCKINLQSRVGTRVQIEDGYYPIVNIESPLQWGKFLFGGMKNNTTKEAVGVYKNGKPKYKKVTTLVKTAAFCDIAPLRGWVSDKTGNVSVDEKVIQYIINNTKITIIKELMTKLLNHRELAKQLTTYIQGLGKHLIKDKATSTDYIYGRLNQVATATGRLSSTSPNLQNISNNPIKKIFVSRWTEPGTWPIATISDSKSFGSLVEFDFSQIEVAVLAHVSKDKQLIKDIKDGLDIHSELHKDMFGSYPDEATRKWFKKLTFGLIYGAGANTLAENAGCTYDTAKHFITAFYKRYPDVACWHKQMALWADTRGEHAVTPLGGLEVNRSCKWQSETGRFYMFREYKSTYRTDRDFTFSPTELKNYPIQGLATGDIVPLMMGILFRKLIGLDGVKLVNTVHDSILLDIRNDVLKDTIRLVGGILNQTSVYFDKTFGHKLELDLKTDCKVGKNWYEMVKEDK